MSSIREWSNGCLGLCVIIGALLTSGCAQSGEDAALAAPANNPGVPGEFSGVTQNWDKALPAAQRFAILAAFNNDAVRDNNTGLVWDRSPDISVEAWSSARFVCANKIVGNQKGWRLPSIAELASLVDPTAQTAPKLPPGHPFGEDVRPSIYWSASAFAGNATVASAWLVNFSTGDVTAEVTSESFRFWCVRGGMNADAY